MISGRIFVLTILNYFNILPIAMPRVFLSLGSNQGDRLENLRQSLKRIEGIKGIEIKKLSSIYETEPVGFKKQRDFLNMVIEISTELEPHYLLKSLQSIEKELGRERTFKGGPRTIDIDILYYGNLILKDPMLIIPHPEIENRRFVLIPLNEIAPEFNVPGGEGSVRHLLERCPDKSRVQLKREY